MSDEFEVPELVSSTTQPEGFAPKSNSQAFEVPNLVGSETDRSQEKELKLRGWEHDLVMKSPVAYGILHETAHFFPYVAKLTLPSARDEFMELDKHDQQMSLLYDALGMAIWGKAAMIAKDVGYLIRSGIKGTKLPLGYIKTRFGAAKASKVVPYEDAVKNINSLAQREVFKPFSYGEEVKRKFIKDGWAKDEAEAGVSYLNGEVNSLLEVTKERMFAGKKSTGGFEKATQWESGRFYPRRVLKEGMLERYSEEVIRGKFYQKQFEEVLLKDVLHAKPSKNTTEAIFDAVLKRVYPNKIGAKFGDLTPEQMVNLFSDMIEHKSVSWEVTYPKLFATMHPARVAFGYGEKVLKTYSNVYKPVRNSLGRTNRNYFNHSLLYAKMLEQVGAYSKVAIKETGEFSVKKAKWLTPQVQDEAYRVMRVMDDLSEQIRRAEAGKGAQSAAKIAETQEVVEGLQKQIHEATKGLSWDSKKLISATKRFFDHLYLEDTKFTIPKVFQKAGLTPAGREMVDKLMTGPEGLGYQLDMLFSTMAETNPTEKISGIKGILKGLRKRLEVGEGEATKGIKEITEHPWFEAKGEELQKTLGRLDHKLTWGVKDGFLNYYDNYVARVSQREDTLLQNWRSNLFKGREAFYKNIRQLERMKGETTDLGTMVQARTMAQARQHYLYDTLDEVTKFTETLPPAWGEYIEGYIGGVLGTPTLSDYKVAMLLTKTVGGIERFMGKEGLWDERRTANLAYAANNLAYLGGLAFKPFSAIRNLFQPLLNVPADLGGLKDIWTLARGYKWAVNPNNRAYLRSLGVIEEYAPEIYLKPPMLVRGITFRGRELPTLEGTRDLGMWMFKTTDRMNRYVTGGAAALKWEESFGPFKQKLYPVTKRLPPDQLKMFSKKLGLGKRHEWIKAEVEDLLMRGKFSEAKSTYIKDVIADTQYLYGVADAPVVLRKHGALGRSGFLFQSWWMNYGSLLQKWMTKGESPGAIAETMFVGMLSQGIAYTLIEPLWGKYTAMETTFLGPFPNEFNEFLIPPTWKPIWHWGVAVMSVQDPHKFAHNVESALSSSLIMVPAGLQMQMSYKGAKAEGFEGFSKSIIGMKPRRSEPDTWLEAAEEEIGKVVD